jgi:hypothetical protein
MASHFKRIVLSCRSVLQCGNWSSLPWQTLGCHYTLPHALSSPPFPSSMYRTSFFGTQVPQCLIPLLVLGQPGDTCTFCNGFYSVSDKATWKLCSIQSALAESDDPAIVCIACNKISTLFPQRHCEHLVTSSAHNRIAFTGTLMTCHAITCSNCLCCPFGLMLASTLIP